MEGTSVHQNASALRGEGAGGWTSVDAKATNPSRIRAQASMTTGCSGGVELGLDRSTFSSERSTIPRTRCSRPVRISLRARLDRDARDSLARGHARRSPPRSCRQRCVSRRACPGFGRSTRARFEELGGCVHVSYRVAEVVRRRQGPEKPSACFHALGERGLAQSGRPRRAKRRRSPSHGGKIVRSVSACVRIRKDAAVVGHRSMEGASGRQMPFPFTRRRWSRSWPVFSEVRTRERRGLPTAKVVAVRVRESVFARGKSVTGASEVGRSRLHRGGEYPLQERDRVTEACGAP